ncbi:hypothetical protein L905_06930 [Agrobacterium sp. TS43]|nr:hypothetical protein L905_06930 [Agrobacterium sp. TS43]
MKDLIESRKELAIPGALQTPPGHPLPAPLSLSANEAAGARPSAGRELKIPEGRDASDGNIV